MIWSASKRLRSCFINFARHLALRHNGELSMAEIGFSMRVGRVRVLFPDALSVADLRAALEVHLAIAELARDKVHDLRRAGRSASDETEG